MLATAYLMMSRDSGTRTPVAGYQAQTLRSEAAAGDSALSSLLEIENALNKHRRSPEMKLSEKEIAEKRVPTQVRTAD